MQCENGKEYKGCGGPAPQTCENLGPGRPKFWNNIQMNEGCFCPDGQISDGKLYYNFSKRTKDTQNEAKARKGKNKRNPVYFLTMAVLTFHLELF